MKICLTGANGALGRIAASRFRLGGHQVAALQRTGVDDPRAGVFVTGDLSDPAMAEAAIGKAVQYLDGLDAMLHLAGAFRWSTVAETTIDDWRTLARDNLDTALGVTRAVTPYLGCGGAIILVGAAAASRADAGMGPYAAAKSGVARLTEALAAELKPRGIRVNAILPAIIDTPANRRDMPDADFTEWTDPDAIADVLLFLSGPEARAISGALIPVTHAA